jgi:hypothetical protein
MLKQVARLAAAVFVAAAVPSVANAQLTRAAQILQDLRREESEASKNKSQAKFTPQYISARLFQVEPFISQGILSLLNQTPPVRPAELARQLAEMQEGGNDVASAFGCTANGRTTYIVAYALAGSVTFSRSWIGAFGPPATGGGNKLLASTDNSLPDKSVKVQPLNCAGEGGLTFLASGVNWGDAHNRLTAIVYALRDRRLRVVWSRADLPEGQAYVAQRRIVLTFETSLARLQKGNRQRTETYRLTPSGMKLETARQESIP